MSASDAQDSGRFGYAQELLREMSGFSNFAILFSILTGAVTIYAGQTLISVLVMLYLIYWAVVRRTYRGPGWARGVQPATQTKP